MVESFAMSMVDDADPAMDRLAWHVYGKNGVSTPACLLLKPG